MRKLCLLLLIISLVLTLSDSVQAIGTIEVTGLQGKATDWRYPDDVISEARLATRNSTPDAKKSWLQFDLSSLYADNPSLQSNITDAKLTFYGAKGETGDKSYIVNGLNDSAGLEGWDATTLTWNNAPANVTDSPTAIDTLLTTTLYTGTVPAPCLGIISETPSADRAALTSFLNEDTNGKITFIFTAGSTCYLWNVGDANEPVLTLYYELGNNPKKAHDPVPADDDIVDSSLSSLSWTNPDPNDGSSLITCTVYFGTDPNKAAMDSETLTAGASSVAINNFTTYTPLTNNTQYYWVVDCHDPSLEEPDPIPGEMWTFFVGQQPEVNAGIDQTVWLGKSGTPDQELVLLDATVTDDGTPTLLWEQVDNGAPEVTIVTTDIEDPTITFTERGDYDFTLTADDGITPPVSDTVKIVVGDDACDASHILTGDPYNEADQNEDCIVDLDDFIALIISDWLNCTDDLTGCGSL